MARQIGCCAAETIASLMYQLHLPDFLGRCISWATDSLACWIRHKSCTPSHSSDWFDCYEVTAINCSILKSLHAVRRIQFSSSWPQSHVLFVSKNPLFDQYKNLIGIEVHVKSLCFDLVPVFRPMPVGIASALASKFRSRSAPSVVIGRNTGTRLKHRHFKCEETRNRMTEKRSGLPSVKRPIKGLFSHIWVSPINKVTVIASKILKSLIRALHDAILNSGSQ